MSESALLETCCPLRQPTLSEDEASELERLFKALADRHRVRIINLLARAEEPVCVCHLEPTLGLSQPAVSYHLKQLLDAGLLERERRGRYIHYRLAEGALDRVGELVRGSAAVEGTTP
ncbi:MAG TPA: metalloregulator ArsR/SmtB family transcription factor [Gaiellaceae bacterium]|nr:metalloregulator ArsR/SmtB family transcription factor [Gaiellaceae bacterium]